jgi:hypothetical protein
MRGTLTLFRKRASNVILLSPGKTGKSGRPRGRGAFKIETLLTEKFRVRNGPFHFVYPPVSQVQMAAISRGMNQRLYQ